MTPSKEKFSTAAGPVHVDVHSPVSTGKHPAVLILHGLGLEGSVGVDIASFAEALTNVNIAAAIPSYFESTHTAPGDEAFSSMSEHLPAWTTTCGAVQAFMAADTRFDATRMGLIGFSLGGHIALSLAMGRPAGRNVKSVVDFFAPTLVPALRGDRSALPPTLIHHGSSDPLTIENSRQLVRELEATRKVTPLIFGKPAPAAVADDQFIEYPGETHGFKGAALIDSRDATVKFLDKHLK